MEFADKTLLSLTDPASAAGLFPQEALRAAAAASYGLAASDLVNAAQPRFDMIELAPFAGRPETEIRHGDYSVTSAGSETGTAPGRDESVQALWRGAITISAAFPRAEIGVANMSTLTLAGLDGDIPGAPPGDPAALETARRAALLARISAAADDDDAFDESVIDDWFAQQGAQSVTQLLESGASAAALTQLALSFTPLPGTAVAAPVEFPVSVALMLRDMSAPGMRLVDLMQASREVLARLELEGIAPKAGSDALPRGRPIVAWLVPQSWFDDPGWSGGEAINGPTPEAEAQAKRAARITIATGWLASNSIALVPVP